MMFTPRAGLAAIRHPLEEGGEHAPRILADAARVLRAAGVDVVEAPGLIEDAAGAVAAGRFFYEKRVPSIVLAVATWSADPYVLDMLEECPVPIVTWGFPSMTSGSMCACQQFDYVLTELNRPYEFAFGATDDAAVVSRIRDYVAAASLAAALRRDRMGLVGYRIPGMTEVAFDEIELKAALGPRTVHYGLDELQKRMGQIPTASALAAWKERMGAIHNVSITQDDIIDSMRGYLAIREFAQRDGLSGITVECYPGFMGRPCLAGSLLADEDVVVGCEADMNSTVAMLILARLTGGPVHNTDPLGVDMKEGSIVYSHCGNGSTRLAESPDKIEIGHVRLMHTGACVLFPGRPGPVTLVNLVGRRGTYRMGVAYGRAVPTKMVFAGNPTRVVIEGGVQRHLDAVAREGLGHHWMIGYGDVRRSLEELCRLTGVRHVPV